MVVLGVALLPTFLAELPPELLTSPANWGVVVAGLAAYGRL